LPRRKEAITTIPYPYQIAMSREDEAHFLREEEDYDGGASARKRIGIGCGLPAG
jgi:hypothetical protein